MRQEVLFDGVYVFVLLVGAAQVDAGHHDEDYQAADVAD